MMRRPVPDIRKFAAVAGVMLVAASIGSLPARAATVTYNIGDTGPGGGVVFITPDTPGNGTGNYFEARLSSVTRNGCNPSTFPTPFPANVVDSTIGAGSANTRAIAEGCSLATADGSAFVWARAENIGGFADWFIPNRGEAERFQAERANPNVLNLVNSASLSPYVSEVTSTGPDLVVLNRTGNPFVFATTSLVAGVRTFLIARMFAPTSPDAPSSGQRGGGPIVLPPVEHTLGFNANGGTCTLTDSGRVNDGRWIQVPSAEECSRPGFTLLGWNPKPDGSDPLGFDPGGWTLMTGDNTLYAIWVPVR